MVKLPPDFQNRPKSSLDDMFTQATNIANGRLVVLAGDELTGFRNLVKEFSPRFTPDKVALITGFYPVSKLTDGEDSPVIAMVKPKLGPALLRAEFQADNEQSSLTAIPLDKLQTTIGSRRI